ncbi:MAG: M1 family aminopeptidase [Bryobacteraceae bacterium]
MTHKLSQCIVRAAALALFAPLAIPGAVHYDVTLTVDPDGQVLRGREVVTVGDGRERAMRFGEGVTVDGEGPGAKVAVKNRASFSYTAKSGRGLRWLADGAGLFASFWCEAWMVCDPEPVERATIRLEIAIPVSAGWTAAGPGMLRRQWREGEYERFVFEQTQPAQTYLFSFGLASLRKFDDGPFTVYAAGGNQSPVFARTRDAWAFLRAKAGVAPMQRGYAQVFLPGLSFGQETAGSALMGEPYRAKLAAEDDVALMTHEAAHQWWGYAVGIRSWSDFWLNEGVAEFMTAAFVEQHQGKAAYDAKMADLRRTLEKIRAEGKDRPLHYTGWKTPTEALGRLPYVKGALFLARLREDLGEARFWNGLASYTRRHKGELVDSRDFQAAMEAAAGRSLGALFDQWVWK